VHTALTATDTGTSRTATTRVVLPEFIPSAVFGHLLTNLDRVHDRIGAGVVELTWAASGKRSDGSPWRLRRREKLADPFDVTFPTADLIAFPVFRLFDNRFEEITVDNVTVSGTVDPNLRQGQLIGLERLGANGRWHPVARRTPLRLVAGTEVFLRGVFRQHRADRLRRVQLSFVVPRWEGSRGTLVISAGVNFFEFFFEEELDESGGPENFDQLLTQIDKAATGDTVRAELHLARRVPGVGRQTITRQARATAPTAVQGNLFFQVQVVSPAG
jgi:hypothetical protein